MPYLQADAKGEIIAYRETSGESLAGYIAAGERLVEADEAYPAATHYVNASNQVVVRPAFSLSMNSSVVADGVSTAPLYGVPTGASLKIEPVLEEGALSTLKGTAISATADGTPISISLDTPGDYDITVELWPYRTEVLHLVGTVPV